MPDPLDVSSWPSVSITPAGEYSGDQLNPAPCWGMPTWSAEEYRVTFDDLLATKVAGVPKVIRCPAGAFKLARVSEYGFAAYYTKESEANQDGPA